MSVGSNFVRPSRRRRAEGDGDLARQETGKHVEGSLRQRLADTAVRNVDMPRGREFRMEASGTPSHRAGEDRSRTPEPNGAPGLSLARDLAPIGAHARTSHEVLDRPPLFLVDVSSSIRLLSTEAISRDAAHGPHRTAPAPSSRARTARHPEHQRCAPQQSRRGWLRSLPRRGPGIARRARRTQGASYAPSASADPTGSRPRAVRALSRRDRARCARPTSRVPRRGSTEPTAAARRFRNRRSSPSSPHPETAVRLGRSAGEDIDNVRRITPISAGRFFDRTALDLLLTPKAAGHFAATRRAILRAAAPTRDPRFNDFSLCVSVMPPLLRASSRRRLTSVGNPRVSSLRR